MRTTRSRASAVDPSDNVLAAGWYANGPWLRKYDPDGGEVWTVLDATLNIDGVASDPEGNVILAGTHGFLVYDIAVRKYNPSGEEVWAVDYNYLDDGDDWGRAVATDPLGFIYVAGSVEDDFSDYDAWLGKFTP